LNIQSVGLNNNINSKQVSQSRQKQQNNPNFKGLMDLPGVVMQGLENSGFIGSFLVQDTLGMTVPRTREGLYRDVPQDKKKNIQNLNFKEGAEVLIREGLSGPLMMFTPVAVLALGKKFAGKSAFTNSSMIKRLGKSLAETVKTTSHDSTKALKKDFYKNNILNIVRETTANADKASEAKFVDKAVESMEMLDKYSEKIANSSGKAKRRYQKAQKRHQANLVEMFNDYHMSNNPNYAMANRVKFDGSVFSTDKVVTGMRSYANDALKGKNISDVTEKYVNNVEKKALVGRFITNALAAASTIASVSIVPKLYSLINPVPPGALANNPEAQGKNNIAQVISQKTNKNGSPSFKGKWDKLAKHFEFDGNQLTPALMTSLAAGGLITPRVTTAVKRAPEDPVTKKKDYSEVPEILTRDVTSTAAVTFGVPLLSKAIVSSYENASGFALQTKSDKPMSKLGKFLDKINPFSSLSPYSLKDINEIYGKVDSTEKLGNFSKFIDNNNGSIAKVFDTIDESKNVFSEYGLNIKELAGQKDRKSANKAIMDKMENKEFAKKLVDLIKPTKDGKANPMLKRARSLNSYTSFASTFLLVPAFLGIVLPRVVYGLTEKRQKKLAEAKAKALENTPQVAQATEQKTDVKTGIDYSKIKSMPELEAFSKFKNN
jgi:hypothetical protein